MVSLEPLFFNQLFRLKSCNLAKENVLIVAQVSKLLEPLSKKQSILSDEEKARCARFVVEPPKESFIVSHVLLRLCLASFLGCDPKEIIFGLKAKKKPYLKLPQLKESPIYFNISHSEDYVAIVFSSVEASGVDIQYHSPSVQIKTVAKRYLCQLEKKHFDNLKNVQSGLGTAAVIVMNKSTDIVEAISRLSVDISTTEPILEQLELYLL